MIRFFLFILALLALLTGFWWLKLHTGTVLVNWQNVELETSLAVFIALLLAVLLVSYGLIGILRFIFCLPSRLNRYSRRRQRKKGLHTFIEACTHLSLEQKTEAKADGYALERYLQTPLAHHVLFEASLLEQNYQKCEQLVDELQKDPDANLLALYDRTRLAFAQKEQVQALPLLLEMERLAPTAPWVLKNLFQVCMELKRYQKALEVAQVLCKHNLLTSEQHNQYQGKIMFTQLEEHHGDVQEQPTIKTMLATLNKIHDLAPDFIPATIKLAKILQVQNKERNARKVIETTWSKTPHPELLTLYLHLAKGDQLEATKYLASFAPRHPESLLSIAQAAIKAEKWPMARATLKELAELHGLSSRGYQLLAQIELNQQRDLQKYQQAMEQAVLAKRAATWQCHDCCSILETWQLTCPNCHHHWQVHWGDCKSGIMQ